MRSRLAHYGWRYHASGYWRPARLDYVYLRVHACTYVHTYVPEYMHALKRHDTVQ
jgi:hypothetical protein